MSEFRQDPVSGDWIINAPGRSKRPHDFLPSKKKRKPTPKNKCPFENLKKTGNWPPIISEPEKSGDKWRVVIIPNKYPAITHEGKCALPTKVGPYEILEGVGYHDVLVSYDHNKNIAHLKLSEAILIFKALRRRYKMFVSDKCMVYASAFMNWGERAGASLYHPHMQILALPIVPPDISHSLRGSHEYFRKNGKCVHCEMIKGELKSGKRIIMKNKDAVVVAPFVSRQAFEVRIYPRKHSSYFEKIKDGEMKSIVSLLQKTLLKIEKELKDPDFNLFIHTAPIKYQNRYHHYHWHIEILPKISIKAGFEMGTGVDITVVNPDSAADILKGKKAK